MSGAGERIVRSPKVEAVPRVVLATISAEVGLGVYDWDRFAGDGPLSGTATELNLSTGITAGTKVVLHEADDGTGITWYFFFPVEACA